MLPPPPPNLPDKSGKAGQLHGAIDDKKTPAPEDIAGAKNYVTAALDDVLAGRPAGTTQTEAYGCPVKYGD